MTQEPQLQEVGLPLRTGLGRWGLAGGDLAASTLGEAALECWAT